MVIMKMKLDNVLAFNNFEVSFSYPQKLKRSLIQNEYLCNYTNFRYKKANIFFGSNASGKTSLIKCIWDIVCLLKYKDISFLRKEINRNNAFIEIDFVDDNNSTYIYRMKIKIDNNDTLIAINRILLKEEDSYEKITKLLDNLEYEYKDYLESLKQYDFNLSWYALLPATEEGFDIVRLVECNSDKERKEYFNILNSVLKSLDTSIMNVKSSNDAKDAIVIEHENVGKIIVQAGNKISNIPYLSSGTKYGISIANMLYYVKNKKDAIFLIDEQFSYVNSDLEKAILSTMISLLGESAQLFYTTHNEDVLELAYPFHSFYFMKKKHIDNKQIIEISCASEVENRNNVSAKSIIDNDIFSTVPNVEKIYELGVKDGENY